MRTWPPEGGRYSGDASDRLLERMDTITAHDHVFRECYLGEIRQVE
jgi:hypothetical protein